MSEMVIFFYVCLPLCFIARYLRRIALFLEKEDGVEKKQYI